MPRTAAMNLAFSGREITELLSGLAAVSAGVLWFWVYLLTRDVPELCSASPRLLGHCPACYPAALLTLAALAGGAMLLLRRPEGADQASIG